MKNLIEKTLVTMALTFGGMLIFIFRKHDALTFFILFEAAFMMMLFKVDYQFSLPKHKIQTKPNKIRANVKALFTFQSDQKSIIETELLELPTMMASRDITNILKSNDTNSEVQSNEIDGLKMEIPLTPNSTEDQKESAPIKYQILMNDKFNFLSSELEILGNLPFLEPNKKRLLVANFHRKQRKTNLLNCLKTSENGANYILTDFQDNTDLISYLGEVTEIEEIHLAYRFFKNLETTYDEILFIGNRSEQEDLEFLTDCLVSNLKEDFVDLKKNRTFPETKI